MRGHAVTTLQDTHRAERLQACRGTFHLLLTLLDRPFDAATCLQVQFIDLLPQLNDAVMGSRENRARCQQLQRLTMLLQTIAKRTRKPFRQGGQ